MVDLGELRETIQVMPPKGRAAVVSRDWLQEVERDLRELAAIREREAAQA